MIFTVNENSWHLRLLAAAFNQHFFSSSLCDAEVKNYITYHAPTSFCSYWLQVMLIILIQLFVILYVGAIVLASGLFLLLVAIIFAAYPIETVLFLMFIGMVIFTYKFFKLLYEVRGREMLSEWRALRADARRAEKTKEISSYSWRDKFCPKIYYNRKK